MGDRTRPVSITVFAILLFASALFMIYLGTMASAYYLCSVCLALAAFCLWSARAPAIFKTILVFNQLTAIVLIVMIAYRRIVLPGEEFTLGVSGTALLGNILFGGPLMGLLSIPLLNMLFRGSVLPAWFEPKAQ